MRPLLLFLAVSLLTLGVFRDVLPWVVDDAFISLRFADRLVAGDGLTWTDGERVEGYSNLLWVLATALLGWLGVDWIVALRVLGVSCTIATFSVLLYSDLLPRSAPARLAVAALASLTITAAWAVGGLESPMLMLWLSVAMAGVHKGLNADGSGKAPLLLAGAALALACWTRPDGPLWTVFAGGAAFVFGRSCASTRWQRLCWVALPAIAAVLLQTGFRIAYYGDWLPNTARAKVASTAASRAAGLDYVASAAVAMRALLVPAAVGLLALTRRAARPALCVCLFGTAAWWLYVLQVGGDTFPCSRLLAPTLVPLTVMAAYGFDVLAQGGRLRLWFATALAAAAVITARVEAELPRKDPRQQLTDWEYMGLAAGEWLGRAFADEQPLVAVDAAGGLPFASRLPCLDMLGLCDREIASTPPPASERFVPGHTRGNGAYVLSRQPDLVLFNLPPGSPQPQWAGGKQLEATPAFVRDYRVLLLQTEERDLGYGNYDDMRITTWARLDGRVGVRRDEQGLSIPGYWLASYRQPFSFLAPPPAVTPTALYAEVQRGAAIWHAGGMLGVQVQDGVVVGEARRPGTYTLERVPLAPGRYRLETPSPTAGVSLRLQASAGSVGAERDGVFELQAADAPTCVDISCTIGPDAELPARIREVRVTRAR